MAIAVEMPATRRLSHRGNQSIGMGKLDSINRRGMLDSMHRLSSNRRDFLRALITGPAGLTFFYAATGQTPTPAPIKATKLSDTLALLAGDGGNVAIVIGDDGLMMVDGGLADRCGELLSAAAEQ